MASILVIITEAAFYWRVHNIRGRHDGVFQRLYWAIMCVAPYCYCSLTCISPSAIETKPFPITKAVILDGLRIAKDRIQKYKNLIELIKTMRQQVSVEFIQETQEGLEDAEDALVQIQEHLSLFDVTDPDADDGQTNFDFRD